MKTPTKSAPKKKPAAKKAPAKRAAAKPVYTATLTVFGRKFVGTSSDGVTGAIAAIELKQPPRVRGILSLVGPKGSKDRVLPIVALQRLFSPSPAIREVQRKNVSLLFDV